ncbi:unnamed protein product [Calicophoron daubneyi]|uniref:UspA domain-containing protein n=1 Tax=Calicophoron daubneyi TaxID=300641 RepID=A0AAV2T4Y1_CALDB
MSAQTEIGASGSNGNVEKNDVEVKSKGEPKRRVILIPVDGSPHSERAFLWYLENMKCDNDCLRFVNVVEPVYTTPAFGLYMESPTLPDMNVVMEECLEEGKKLCQYYLERGRSAHVNCRAFLHVDNKPGPALVKSITEHEADIVIMGNRGLGIVRRTFLGSVSEYVLHHAHVAIIIVPPPEPAKK